jgi:pimeloyl-ACP methyl ester carboxylesterase
VTLVGVIVVLLASGILYQWIATRRYRRRFAPPGELVDVGGHRLHMHCMGGGGPVVLLEAGIAASSISWSLVQSEIATFTRVCAYDRAGLAWSDATSGPITFEQIVSELSRVLAHAAPHDQYVLVGHSFGSFVIQAHAERHPEKVVGLVLVDPPTEWLTMTPHRERMLRRGQRLSRVGAVLAHIGMVRGSLALLTGGAPGAPRRFVSVLGPTALRTLQRLVGEVKKLPPDVHPVIQELWCQPKCFHAMAEHLSVLRREGKALAALNPPPGIPVVVISSGNQPPEQIAEHRALADRSAKARHFVAARSTHWVQFDEPGLIVDAVRELIDKQGVVRSAHGDAR